MASLKQELQQKEEAMQEYLLSLNEKELLLAELTLLARDQKTEIIQLNQKVVDLEEVAKAIPSEAPVDVGSMLRRRSQAFVPAQANYNRRNSKLGGFTTPTLRPFSAGPEYNNVSRRGSGSKGGGSSTFVPETAIVEEGDGQNARPVTAPTPNGGGAGGRRRSSVGNAMITSQASEVSEMALRSRLKDTFFNGEQSNNNGELNPMFAAENSAVSFVKVLSKGGGGDKRRQSILQFTTSSQGTGGANYGAPMESSIAFGTAGVKEIQRRKSSVTGLSMNQLKQ